MNFVYIKQKVQDREERENEEKGDKLKFLICASNKEIPPGTRPVPQSPVSWLVSYSLQVNQVDSYTEDICFCLLVRPSQRAKFIVGWSRKLAKKTKPKNINGMRKMKTKNQNEKKKRKKRSRRSAHKIPILWASENDKLTWAQRKPKPQSFAAAKPNWQTKVRLSVKVNSRQRERDFGERLPASTAQDRHTVRHTPHQLEEPQQVVDSI